MRVIPHIDNLIKRSNVQNFKLIIIEKIIKLDNIDILKDIIEQLAKVK